MPKMLLTDMSVKALKGSGENEKFFDTKTPGFAVRVGHQHLHQLEPVVRHAVLANVGTLMQFELSERALALEALSCSYCTAPRPISQIA